MADPFNFGDAALAALREEVRLNLQRFAATKPGKVVQEVGSAILQARREGRALTKEEIEKIATRIPEILHGDSK